MNEVERKLKELGERAERALAPEARLRPKALRRIRFRRRVLSGGLVLCTLLVVAGGVALSGGAERKPPVNPARPTTTDDPDDTTDRDPDETAPPLASCEDVWWEPTYLPTGIAWKLQPGSGGDASVQDGDGGILGHYRGPQGVFIDVTVPRGGGFAETNTESIRVLGIDAVLGDIHEGYAVELTPGRCSYELLGYGIAREELRSFAEGLVSTIERGPHFAAVWPEDTVGAAHRGCETSAPRERDNAVVVAVRFVQGVLRWETPTILGEQHGESGVTIEVMPPDGEIDEPGIEPGVTISLREVVSGCWSVTSVSPLAQSPELSLSVGVDDNVANIDFTKFGASSATVTFAYGGNESMTHWHRGDKWTRLNVAEPRRTTGHFMVLLREADGDIFSAIGRTLPPGDFAAG